MKLHCYGGGGRVLSEFRRSESQSRVSIWNNKGIKCWTYTVFITMCWGISYAATRQTKQI